MKEKKLKKDIGEWGTGGLGVVGGGVPSFQTQRREETLLAPTGKWKKKEKRKEREILPECRAAAVDGYHMLQVKVEKLLPDSNRLSSSHNWEEEQEAFSAGPQAVSSHC